jgi:adenosylhomocysteine nucleosidase
LLNRLNKIGIIAGLKSELRCLGLGRDGQAHAATFAAGGSAARAHTRAREWIAQGHVRALMSFGLCGGLDPALKPGTVLVAHQIKLHHGGTLRFDGRWARAIAARIPEALIAPLLGLDRVAATVEQKRSLFERHATPAVDMESAGIARAAHEAQIPFVALRAVADPAHRTLPPAAFDAMDAQGGVRPLRVLFRLLRRPGDLMALLALAADARRGYDALLAARDGALVPHLAPALDADARLPELVPAATSA